MAKYYTLQRNETVLRISRSGVQRGGAIIGALGELVLTSFHLIWVGKGIFGNVKQVECMPLGLVKVHNAQAQAFLTKNSSGLAQLSVFFQDGEEVFRFQNGGKREVGEWVAAINQAVTGNVVVPESSASSVSMALPGTEHLTDVLRDTLSQFRNAFGGGVPVSSAPPPLARVTAECPSCGAPVSGITGAVAKCQYCDTESRLRP